MADEFGALDLVLEPGTNKTILSVVMQINCWQDPNNGHPNNKNIPKQTFLAQKYPKSNLFGTNNIPNQTFLAQKISNFILVFFLVSISG